MSIRLMALSFSMALLLSKFSNASTVAIIDSGNDFLHKDLKEKAWVNPLEIPNNDRDEDRNGYQDDVNGWNFAEQNSSLIDYSYSYSYDADVKKLFEIQLRSMLGTLTENDRTWVQSKMQDEAFMKRLQIFGNWMHGTHVTGIAAKETHDARFVGMKLIPTEVKLPGQKSSELIINGKSFYLNEKQKGAKEFLVKKALKALATAQAQSFKEIGAYVQMVNADIANGSFGTPNSSMTQIIGALYKTIFKKEATKEELKSYVDYYFDVALTESKVFTNSSPKTLFVFAAGNEGLDNDIYPTSPANVLASNKIVVAATLFNRDLAEFSNYGLKMVDIAAPGVGIVSQIPMDNMMAVSGTSQAAPYVARVASLVKDANTNLNPEAIKEILMGTVDFKPWLKLKVRSGGIVNLERAVRASELAKTMRLPEAIKMARNDILDQSLPELPTSFVKSKVDQALVKKLVGSLPDPLLVKVPGTL